MTVKSHITLTLSPLVVYFAYNTNYLHNYQFVLTALTGAFIGAILPDIDEPNSYIGRKLIFISEPLKMLGLKHRTITHSIFFAIFFALFGYFNIIFYFIAYGIFMHLIEDAITNTGIPFFYPLYKKRIGVRLFDTGTISEYVFTFAILVFAALAIFNVR